MIKALMSRWAFAMVAAGACWNPVWAESAAGLPREVSINGVEFVLIPGGEFFKSGGVPARPEHYDFMANNLRSEGHARVWVDAFYIGKFEARARDLVRFLNDARRPESATMPTESCTVDVDLDGLYAEVHADGNHPATHLSWAVADRWARWMGFRLPTEAEWEKAARGTDRRQHPWGDDIPDDTFAGANAGGPCRTWPVDSFEKGKSPYGVYNMAGNVRELVADWYSAELDRTLADGARNPRPENGSLIPGGHRDYNGPWRIIKGGRWASWPEELLISARVFYPPDLTFRCNGTRFAVDTAMVAERLKNGTAVVLRP